ncbi:LysR family transcriptional regulator [Lentzea sp. NPDC006480]|uniref:LysR family transcriptional regulator n=1 Tax=Lentzea sp. NPDC006480 TaxID=3157176 RepID=UPI0033A57A1F
MGEFTVVGLRVVREAARHGSFSTAAERLGYTQSAVSRQIALMEQAAGQALFERQARGVRLTEAGQVVVRHAEAVLGELGAAQQHLQDLKERPATRLRVGAFSTAMAVLVPTAIAAAGPTRVTVREGLSPGLVKAVQRGRLDLAVVTGVPSGEVEMTPLPEDPLFVATGLGHPFAGQTAVTVKELKNQRWIAGSSEPGTTLLGTWVEEPEIAYVARDWVAKLGLVAAGLGVTIVPGLVVPALPPSVAVVRVDHPEAVRATAVVGRAHPHVEAFTELLRDAAAELAVQVRRRVSSHFA